MKNCNFILEEKDVGVESYRSDGESFYRAMVIIRKAMGEQKVLPEQYRTRLVSDIVPAATEAFFLWVMEDKFNVWLKQEEKERGTGDDEVLIPEPKYTLKASTADKLVGGVSLEGMTRFFELMQQVVELREDEETGKNMEEAYMRRCRSESENNKRKRTTNQLDEDAWKECKEKQASAFKKCFQNKHLDWKNKTAV